MCYAIDAPRRRRYLVPITEGKSVPSPPQVVVETRPYLAKAEKLLEESEAKEIVDIVATNPLVGDLIRGTGGVRKFRFALGARGKSGGARVIYFFHDEDMPIYLLTIFPKNQKVSLTKAEKNQLRALTEQLVRTYKEAHDE